MSARWDVVVVGAGPNGLVAALRLARAGRSVLVVEGANEPGGGLRTAELLEPGVRHDLCATVQALVPLSPALSWLDRDLVAPTVPLAHPFDDGSAVLLHRSLAETARGLGPDGAAYRGLIAPLVERSGALFSDLLAPLIDVPRHPLLLARFGVPGLLSASSLGKLTFRGERARALLAGAAARSILSLHEPITTAFGLVMLISAHAGGWPFARGGSSTVADALVAALKEAGGEVRCGERVSGLDQLPKSKAVVLDLVPRDVLAVAGGRLSGRYRRRLEGYRRGPGVFKLDWTLNGPIPWRAAECALAGTVHLGGTWLEIARSEDQVARPARRAAIRAAHPANPVRSVAGARGPACGVGIRPRPERLAGGHDRAHRGADRALRARVSRPGAGAERLIAGGDGGARAQLCGWRY